MDRKTLLQLTSEIVASHASVNEVSAADLVVEIQNVFNKLAELGGGLDSFEAEEGVAEVKKADPAIPLAAAFGSDKIFCMVCGKGMKTLKRHLMSAHGLKPGQYRKQFDIPAGTQLVAKNYSEKRKKLAKKMDLAERLVKARAARGKKKK